MKNYTTIFEFGRLHEFEFVLVTTLIYYIITNIYEFLVIFNNFFSTDFVIIKKTIIKN